MKVSRTKITGWLMIVTAFSGGLTDALDGGGFDFMSHINLLILGLTGAGLVFMRDAIKKLQGGIR